jgi:pyridoxamine 5'-phosphate oxidase
MTQQLDLATLRREYADEALDERDVPADPLALFGHWFREAVAAGVPEPNGMSLATVGSDGRPSVRVVLLKGVDHGFVFFTNRSSRKGLELGAGFAALALWWEPLARQVRVEGRVELVSDAESDAYFAVRPRDAQLGAWASPQSTAVADRAALDAAHVEAAERFGDGPVPRPPHWGGYRVLPDVIEFWQGRQSRLHDRVRYRLAGSDWVRERLAP